MLPTAIQPWWLHAWIIFPPHPILAYHWWRSKDLITSFISYKRGGCVRPRVRPFEPPRGPLGTVPKLTHPPPLPTMCPLIGSFPLLFPMLIYANYDSLILVGRSIAEACYPSCSTWSVSYCQPALNGWSPTQDAIYTSIKSQYQHISIVEYNYSRGLSHVLPFMYCMVCQLVLDSTRLIT